jgi:general secretion pathway protein I
MSTIFRVKKLLRTMSKPSTSLTSLHDSAAFTLLEVMIAIAIMAIALTTLYGSQSRSLSYATEAHFYVVASSLAAAKLAELQSGVGELVSDSGDFGDDFPGYSWQLEVEDATLEEFDSLADLEDGLQRVDLNVEWSESSYNYALRYYDYRTE